MVIRKEERAFRRRQQPLTRQRLSSPGLSATGLPNTSVTASTSVTVANLGSNCSAS
jgi:hypothetical protein